MAISKLAFSLILTTLSIQCMDRYLPTVIPNYKENKKNILDTKKTEKEFTQNSHSLPPLISLAIISFSQALVSEDTHSSKEGKISSFTLAEQIEEGTFHHVYDADDIKKVLVRDNLMLLADLCKPLVKPIIFEHEEAENDYHVNAVALSPDGKKIAVSTSQITIWDISNLPDSGEPLVLRGPELHVKESGLHWSDDGSHLFAYKKGYLFCWEVSSGKSLFSYRLSEQSFGLINYESMGAFSPCGKYFLAMALGPKMEEDLTWNGSLYCQPRESYKGVLFDLDLVKNYFAVPKEERADEIPHTVISTHKKIWQEKPSSNLLRRLFITFSPDSRFAVTAGADNTARLCELSQLPEIKSIVLEQKGIVCALAFSPDCKRLVTVSKVCTTEVINTKKVASHSLILYLWNLGECDGDTKIEPEILKTFVLYRATSPFNSCEFPLCVDFDGRFILLQAIYFDGKYQKGYNRYVYDLKKRSSIVLNEKLLAWEEDSGTFFTRDMKYIIASGLYKNTDVSLIPLLGPAEEFTVPQLLLLAKLHSGVLDKKLNGKALKVFSSFSEMIKKRIKEYFGIQD